MDTLEYMKLVCGILTVIITYGGFRMYTDRRKYIQEVEKLKAEVRDAQVNTRGSELDNVQKAMQILMEDVYKRQIVIYPSFLIDIELNERKSPVFGIQRVTDKSEEPG